MWSDVCKASHLHNQPVKVIIIAGIHIAVISTFNIYLLYMKLGEHSKPSLMHNFSIMHDFG